MNRLKGGDMVCEALVKEGVEVIFGLPGGAALPLYDMMTKYEDKLRHVLVRHEQAAAHAADGYARATGRVGVCLATSGPGATNLVTGIATAVMDSVPMVALTANVVTGFLGRDGFQETDITGITLPITKHNYLVMRAVDIPTAVKEAFHIASTGRPGPVLVDIPKDILQGEAPFHYPERVQLRGYRPTYEGNPVQIKKAAKLMTEAKRPIIMVGHGVIISNAYDEVLKLAETTNVPVIQTLLGLSAFPVRHPLAAGMIGMHGMAYANYAVHECDLLIGIGMRFDDRVTGKISGFAPHAQIIHIDIDPAEIGKNIHTAVPIVGDVKAVLKQLNKEVQPGRHLEWHTQINEWKRRYPIEVPSSPTLLPQVVCDELNAATDGDCILVTDVGQHQMWAAQFYQFRRANCHITSGGLGTMGFALPASMGVAMGRPNEMVWCVAGDGGFQMTMQELGTIAEENIPVKIAIINNNSLGMVRQWQEFFYERRYKATPLKNPDYVKIGEAYGIPSVRATEKNQVRPAIEEAMNCSGPFMIEFLVETEENVFPMVPAGGSNSEMLLGQPEKKEVAV